jgi:1-deoxy-D-xylulose-5-phosphate reductoisomerase
MRLTVLGSTGSIGTNTLDVARQNRDLYSIYALAAGRNVELLLEQIKEFHPSVVVVVSDSVLQSLTKGLQQSGLARSEWPELAYGEKAKVDVATAAETDFVMSAIVGVEGLKATYEAVRAGKTVGLANKEVLVASGQLVMAAAIESKAPLIPVDSEHNGAHQCLRAGRRDEVARLILTASGGPFRNTPVEELSAVTPEQALNHPTWKMGRRITIDSATMMNKGFEVIEACWLFDFERDDVGVVIHPQSTVHAMVEYKDGSVIAQVSTTDMRMPIQYALTYPARSEAPVPRLDWTKARSWDFFPPDLAKFPLLSLAYQAQRTGGSATCTLNAADEIAVESFLNGEIGYLQIAAVVEETLERTPVRRPAAVEEVLEIDRESRETARAMVARHAASSGPNRRLVTA